MTSILRNKHIRELEIIFKSRNDLSSVVKNLNFIALETIVLTNIDCFEEDLVVFNQFPKLKKVDLRGCYFHQTPYLKSFDFSSAQLEAFGLKEVGEYSIKKNLLQSLHNTKNLKKLSLTIHLDDFDLLMQLLKKLNQIEYLELLFENHLDITQSFQLLNQLLSFEQLEILKLSYMEIDQNNFGYLDRLLEKTTLHDIHMNCFYLHNPNDFIQILNRVTQKVSLTHFSLILPDLSFSEFYNEQLQNHFQKILTQHAHLVIFEVILDDVSLFEHPLYQRALNRSLKQHYHLLKYDNHLAENIFLLRNRRLHHCYFIPIQQAFEEKNYVLLPILLLRLEKEFIHHQVYESLNPIFYHYFFQHLPFYPEAFAYWFDDNMFQTKELQLCFALELFSLDMHDTFYRNIFLILFLKPHYSDEMGCAIVKRCYCQLKMQNNCLVLPSNLSYELIYQDELLSHGDASREYLKQVFLNAITPTIIAKRLNNLDKFSPIDTFFGLFLFVNTAFFAIHFLIELIKHIVPEQKFQGNGFRLH